VDATIPDLLRLLAVPVLGWAAVQDVRTRRIPNRTWYPLAALGAGLLLWEALALGVGTPRFGLFLVRTLLSVGLVGGLGLGFWTLGSFGGADAKAFFALALLFPTYPGYQLAGLTLPAVVTDLGVFSFTVLTNAVLVGATYPLALAVVNARAGTISPLALVARRVSTGSLTDRHGTLLDTGGHFTQSGLDLDALRMYLRWRRIDLPTLRSNPSLVDPATLPADPGEPTDGAVDEMVTAGDSPPPMRGDGPTEGPIEDRWGAAAFLEALEGSAYGTSPEALRAGLDRIADADRVWVSPGIPFIVPTFLGLLLALTLGDLLFLALEWVGLVT
jgi:preflagellin peptidase FlaK